MWMNVVTHLVLVGLVFWQEFECQLVHTCGSMNVKRNFV